MYKNGLGCCLKHLGSNTLKTGCAFFNLAEVFLIINKKLEALVFFQKAFSVYKVHKKTKMIIYSDIALKISQILQNFGFLILNIFFAKMNK